MKARPIIKRGENKANQILGFKLKGQISPYQIRFLQSIENLDNGITTIIMNEI